MYLKDAMNEYAFDCRIRKLSPRTLDNYTKQLRYVYVPDKSSGHPVQEIEISYNYISILHASLMQNVQNAKTA